MSNISTIVWADGHRRYLNGTYETGHPVLMYPERLRDLPDAEMIGLMRATLKGALAKEIPEHPDHEIGIGFVPPPPIVIPSSLRTSTQQIAPTVSYAAAGARFGISAAAMFKRCKKRGWVAATGLKIEQRPPSSYARNNRPSR